MDEYIWLTHPDLPDNAPVRQPAGSSLVENMIARGWVETENPELAPADDTTGDTPGSEGDTPAVDPDALSADDTKAAEAAKPRRPRGGTAPSAEHEES